MQKVHRIKKLIFHPTNNRTDRNWYLGFNQNFSGRVRGRFTRTSRFRFVTKRHRSVKFHSCEIKRSGFGGLEVACWPLVPKFAGSNPAEAEAEKILCTPSIGVEVKPSVPCRRFRACKRSRNLCGSRNLGKITTGHLSRPQLHLQQLGSLASLRTQWHVAAKVGTSKGGRKQWQTTPKNLPRMQCAKSHIGSITGLWFLPDRPLGLNTNE